MCLTDSDLKERKFGNTTCFCRELLEYQTAYLDLFLGEKICEIIYTSVQNFVVSEQSSFVSYLLRKELNMK